VSGVDWGWNFALGLGFLLGLSVRPLFRLALRYIDELTRW
jgi:hypothetical protein